MKKLFFSIISIGLAMTTSCSNPQNSDEHQERLDEDNGAFDHTPALPDSLQLDSITGDSVDYNSPESPRM